MKTTLNLNDTLLTQAKTVATRQHMTLTRFIYRRRLAAARLSRVSRHGRIGCWVDPLEQQGHA
jgi:hypothetical protein